MFTDDYIMKQTTYYDLYYKIMPTARTYANCLADCQTDGAWIAMPYVSKFSFLLISEIICIYKIYYIVYISLLLCRIHGVFVTNSIKNSNTYGTNI